MSSWVHSVYLRADWLIDWWQSTLRLFSNTRERTDIVYVAIVIRMSISFDGCYLDQDVNVSVAVNDLTMVLEFWFFLTARSCRVDRPFGMMCAVQRSDESHDKFFLQSEMLPLWFECQFLLCWLMVVISTKMWTCLSLLMIWRWFLVLILSCSKILYSGSTLCGVKWSDEPHDRFFLQSEMCSAGVGFWCFGSRFFGSNVLWIRLIVQHNV